jgi:NAD(P)-dependent dehydrogenase (short-subunit alcohol dehydrogenase family)
MSLDLGRQGITCVLLHPGYVRTSMTGHQGLIDVDTCVSGLLSVLEGTGIKGSINGRWFDYKKEEIPW